MIERRLSEIASAVHGTLRGPDAVASSAETDSRAVGPGGLFVAIEGDRLDGHAFVGDAVARGAVAALVHRSGIDGTVIEVPHTGRALLDLAADERERMIGTRVVGITGSNGKTSAKDLAAAVVGTRLRTHASPASFNNEVGLPMTLLGADRGVEVVVAEMGARREGDVRLLCDVARPDAVVVTNVGTAHLGIFGSWDAIVRAGSEPVEWLCADGTAIVNADDPVARAYADETDAAVITFGLDPAADVRAEDVELGPDARATFTLWSAGEREPVALAVPGDHMVSNALAAAAVGRWAGVTLAECATALKGAGIGHWRMETSTGSSGIVIVNDAYNANPESMAAALKSARWMAKGERLVAVLGHMAELGPVEFEEHEKLGRLVVRIGVERLITVGEQARTIARAAIREGQLPGDVSSYEDPSDAAADVRAWARPGDVVLVKGSRVAGLERVAEALG
jgi:UDP-N-acetylmuramoyl-tripeptide--D-alanyl-D-alanine ligase